jgi:hypothetical protein
MNSFVRFIIFALACAFAYHSYDSFRSAFTGTKPTASTPNKNPRAISTRTAGIAWGLISLAISLAAFWGTIIY